MSRHAAIPAQPTPAQRKQQARFDAAVELERARQAAREAGRYGGITRQHQDRVAAAEQAWNNISRTAGWAVVER